jgi:hypothetical protein
MLSDQERRQLGELELQLEAEDPRFVGKFRSIADHLRSRLIVALLVMIAGMVTAVVGLAQTDVAPMVAGLLLMGTGACVAAGWQR